MRLKLNHALAGSSRLSRLIRFLIVALGVIFGQAVLYGPSLIGVKILLPLKMLAPPYGYLPNTGGYKDLLPHNPTLSDLVFFNEPERLFAHEEFMAGRFPLWTPHRFAGAPLYTMGYEPHWIPAYLIKSPIVLAWVQLSVALTAGLGMYVFCRRVMCVGYWPAAIVAWCYPVTGAYVIWQGWWLPAVMCWLPWMMLAVDLAIRRPQSWGGPAVALITVFILISGAQDIAGQVLLTSGIYAVWCFFDCYGLAVWPRQRFLAIGVIFLAWGVGMAGSAWLMLPFREYVSTGSRMIARSAGNEERPPIGLSELPQLVLPGMYGDNTQQNLRIAPDLTTESSVGGYAGLLATLLLAPLALRSRPHRSVNILMIVLTFVALSWVLNIPGMVQIWRLPVLNMMSHNRFVFVASMSILSLAAVGLDMIFSGSIARRWWFEVPIIVIILLCGWCVYRAIIPPNEISTELADSIKSGRSFVTIRTMADVKEVQSHFRQSYVSGAILSVAALAYWYLIRARRSISKLLYAVIPVLMLGELLYFGYGLDEQADPELYYPKVDMLEQLKQNLPGRFMGFGCFPPNLAQAVGLSDLRGYDGVDPSRMVELIRAGSYPDPQPRPYAVTQFLRPNITMDSSGKTLFSPILDMLGVRYAIIMASNDQVKADLGGGNYWALINKNVLPRVFIPEQIQMIVNDQERLQALSRSAFNPREVAYVEQPVDLNAQGSGSTQIVAENPTRITILADMRSRGLVVLADNWDIGWCAYINGARVPVLRVNHALRGVLAPAGKSTIEFRFEPASLRRGLQIAGAAIVILVGWSVLIYRYYRVRGRMLQSLELSGASNFRCSIPSFHDGESCAEAR